MEKWLFIKNTSIQCVFTVALIIGFQPVIAQTYRCGTDQVMQKWQNDHPELIVQANKIREELLQKMGQKSLTVSAGTVFTIPIVFHILHDNGSENISDYQVITAVQELNKNFRLQNSDTAEIHPNFKQVASDSEIQFELARKDPNGSCTNGINRIQSSLTYLAGDNSKISQWPRDKYLNVWVVHDLDDGDNDPQTVRVGYTYMPSNVVFQPAYDGIIIRSDFVGTTGTSTTDKTRSLSHEIGHWIGLEHTWGGQASFEPGNAGNCAYDDGLGDTPNTIGTPFGCNTNQITCGSLDNVQNYMDYAACPKMFTKNQSALMRMTLQSSVSDRANLISASNHTFTGIDGLTDELCNIEFYSNRSTICSGDTFQLLDASYGGVDAWQWWLSFGAPDYSVQRYPEIVPYGEGKIDVTLKVKNDTTTMSLTKEDLVMVMAVHGQNMPASESFENNAFDEKWMVKNNDGDVNTWSLYTSAGSNGANSVKMTNLVNNTGQIDELISSSYDLSNMSTTKLTFDVAFAQKTSASTDQLRAYFSVDCGENWTPAWVRGGTNLASVNPTTSEFTPSGAADWKSFNFNLNPLYLKSNVSFKFEFTSGGGNNLYLDNINLSGNYNPIPQLMSPADGFIGTGENVLLNWKACGGVEQYEVQLDTDAGFGSANKVSVISNYAGFAHDGSETEYFATSLIHGGNYYWRVRSLNSGTTSAWSDVWTFSVGTDGVGINQSDYTESLKVYPNPSNGFFSVEYHSKQAGEITLFLTNILGKKLYHTQAVVDVPGEGKNTININHTNLKPGVYFIQMHSKTKILKEKIIIQAP